MWLLKPEVALAMREAKALNYQPTQAERDTFAVAMKEAYAERPAGMPRCMAVAGDTAELRVEGVLTEKPDCFALMFGGGNATYADIRKSLALADADPAVKRIVMHVASPGGHVSGLFETLAAIQAVQKPIEVRASLAASAAYAIAAVAGPIEAVTAASEFGSIGVAVRVFVDDEAIDLTSTHAPNKRPDVSTEEGRAVIVEQLDAIHELFAEAIAAGRETTTKIVNAEYGRGTVYLAAEARKRGMIDRIAKGPANAGRKAKYASAENGGAESVQPITGSSPVTAKRKMTKEELKAQHPELFAAVLNDGVKAERDRVCAHLILGEKSGAIDTAFAAIKNGDDMTATLTATYLAAGMNRADRQTRQAESNAAGAAADAVAPQAEPAADLGDLVVAAMLAEQSIA